MGLTGWYVKYEEFQCLSPYGFCTQRRIKSLMLLVLWICTFMHVAFDIVGYTWFSCL